MSNLILTPLGAGNYQYVVRIRSSIVINNHCNNNGLINTKNGNKVTRITNKNGIYSVYKSNLGLIPRFCVLKILKRENVHDYISRIQFHYEFNHVFNHFTNLDSIPSKCLNNIATNVPNKRLCIIERKVSHKLRNVFNQLLVPNSSHTDKSFAERDSNYLLERQSVKATNKNKVMIFYDKLLEVSNSIQVDPNSIKVLYSSDLVYHNRLSKDNDTFPLNGCFFDDNTYELCSIEDDLFNYNSVLKIKNNFLPNYCDRDQYKDIRNISLELKLKCGLRNFQNYPSLFEMNQINKRNVNYIISNGCSVSNAKQKSFYDPCAFFELNYKSVKSQLINLIQIPQNNLRIFVNNYQQIPNILLSSNFDAHLPNGISNGTHHTINGSKDHNKYKSNTSNGETYNDLIEMIVKSILENKRKLLLLLKLQALAAGQQFVSCVLYSLYNLFLRIQNVSNGPGNYDIFNPTINTVYGLNCGDNVGNCSVNDGDIVSIIKAMNLYKQFRSDKLNHYHIQRQFYKRGIKLLYTLHIKLLYVLNDLKMCKYYTSNANLSIHRRSNRFNHNKYLFFILLNDLVACLSSLNHKQTNISTDVNTINGGLDLLMLNDSSIKAVLKTLYYRNKPNKMKPVYHSINCFPTNRELKLISQWIYLYLCGRVSMDLSVIINIFYQSKNGSNHANDILYNKLSFVDVDLKSIHNIYKWKYNVMNLINSFNDST